MREVSAWPKLFDIADTTFTAAEKRNSVGIKLELKEAAKITKDTRGRC
jgi:hypothetical protein